MSTAARSGGTEHRLPRARAARRTGWHPALGWLVAASDPAAVSRFEFTTAPPVKPWPTSNVAVFAD